MFWTSTAYAMAGGQGGEGGGNAMLSFMPLILMFAVFYFLAIRPQQKKTKAHNAMLASLQKGDYILTNTGIFARIMDIEGDIMHVDMDGTKVRMLRSAIAARTDAHGKLETPIQQRR